MSHPENFMTFRTKGKRPGKTSPKDWTDIVCRGFDRNGNNIGDVIINSFGGSDGGKSEAKRFVDLLNEAVRKFHNID